MSFNQKTQLYVSRKTVKRLWDVISVYPSTYDQAMKVCRNADDLADWLLNFVIDRQYPEEKKLREAKDKAESEVALRIRSEMPELEVNHVE